MTKLEQQLAEIEQQRAELQQAIAQQRASEAKTAQQTAFAQKRAAEQAEAQKRKGATLTAFSESVEQPAQARVAEQQAAVEQWRADVAVWFAQLSELRQRQQAFEVATVIDSVFDGWLTQEDWAAVFADDGAAVAHLEKVLTRIVGGVSITSGLDPDIAKALGFKAALGTAHLIRQRVGHAENEVAFARRGGRGAKWQIIK